MKYLSPVRNQDFIWIAEYSDGSYLTEFDLSTLKENSFYFIDKSKLIRFGLIGHNNKLFFEIYGGYFNICGLFLEFIFKTKDKEYPLTGHKKFYNDIITFKDAECDVSLSRISDIRGSITKFNFGYKTVLKFDDIEFTFKPICVIPFNQPVYINIWIVSNKYIEGEFIIRKNGLVSDKYDCRLSENIGGSLNWIVR